MQTTQHLRQRLSPPPPPPPFFLRPNFFSLLFVLGCAFLYRCHCTGTSVYTTTVIRSRLSFSACMSFVPACALKKRKRFWCHCNLHHHRLYTHSSCSCLSVPFSARLLFVLAYALFMGAIVLYRHLCLYTTADTDTTHSCLSLYQYHSLLVSCLSYALFMGSTLLYRLLCQQHHH